MPRISQKFIERKVRRPDTGQVIYRDDELIGFGLRVTRGSMSYIVECRVNGTNRRVTIRLHGRFDPDTAREEAKKLLVTMTRGKDPREEEAKEKVAQITLGEVLEDYFLARTLRPNSVRSFRQIIKRCLGDWVTLPITGITKEMVESRHRELTKVTRQGTSGKAQANAAMEQLCTLVNFAMNKYEIDGKPIIQKNPVDRLSQIRAWHRIPPRQSVIPEHKLISWYQAVLSIRDKKVRDYFLLRLFTGLRRTEAATLKWTDIDFEGKVLTIRSELAKNHREHRLPLTEFLARAAQKKNERSSKLRVCFSWSRRQETYGGFLRRRSRYCKKVWL